MSQDENKLSAQDASASAPSISRRGVVCGAAGAVVVLALGGAKFFPSEAVVRPPGAQDEEAFLSGCIRCQKCMEVCPQKAINIGHVEDGLLTARTPVMDFEMGYCNYCQNVDGGPRCAAVCPTKALQHLTGKTTVIGVATVTKDWCLAYRGMGCHSCLDACDKEGYNAISLASNNAPVVDTDKCNGCGACENACISMTDGSMSGAWDGTTPTHRAIIVEPLSR